LNIEVIKMSKINAFTIQQRLGQLESVSIPWIQMEYSLSYRDAKAFLNQLISRAWVGKHPCGIYYAVRPENLRLRVIDRSEVDVLFEKVTTDCVSALQCIREKKGGATFDELVSAVRGDEDTRDALETLQELNLIYKADELYFSCVSDKTIKVMGDVEAEKRRMEMHRKIRTGMEDMEKCRRLFDALFDEE
jgi:hypothetical protein